MTTRPVDTLAHAVARRGVLVLVSTLLAVGVATGAALHFLQRELLDRALLAAAMTEGEAGERRKSEWDAEHVDSAFEVFTVRPGDLRVPKALAKDTLRSERAAFTTYEEHRLALVVVERAIEGQDHRGEEGEEHRLVAARTPMPGIVGTVGPFAVAYGLVAIVAAAVAGWSFERLVRGAFLPLDRARVEAARLSTLSTGKRLTVGGPEEVRALLDAVNGLLDRLDAAHLAQSRFTAEAAHELRTPVTSMLGELDVALRRPRTAEEYRAVLASAREEVDRLRRLVEALLTLARLDAGQGIGPPRRLTAADLVDAAVSAEAEELAAANCTLDIQTDGSEILVEAPLVEMALGNLLRNAARHAPGAPVRVDVFRQGDQVVFRVDDGGPGLGEGPHDALFDRFVRGGAARRDDRAGLGLGLPLVREIAVRLGGSASLTPGPEGGARAELRLPCVSPRG